jgi:hypothetical protein
MNSGRCARGELGVTGVLCKKEPSPWITFRIEIAKRIKNY